MFVVLLVNDVDKTCTACPFLIERVLYQIWHISCAFVSCDDSIVDLLWSSIRLLMNIPVSLFEDLGSRLASGLSSFVRLVTICNLYQKL